MYFLTKTRVCVEGEEYTVYGMKFNEDLRFDDISEGKGSVSTLVEDCNKYQLEPIHMLDVIEDFLAGL